MGTRTVTQGSKYFSSPVEGILSKGGEQCNGSVTLNNTQEGITVCTYWIGSHCIRHSYKFSTPKSERKYRGVKKPRQQPKVQESL